MSLKDYTGIEVRSELEINWRKLGHDFASLTDEQQADFFEGLARETVIFSHQIDWPYQFSYVADKLSKGAKARLRELLGAILADTGEEASDET